jgi:hypothetical protein
MLLHDIFIQYKDKINFTFIYINEAHAVDVWPIGMSAGTINYSHKQISDRSECATKLINTFDLAFPIYLDNMNNDFENIFSAWPFRYYVISYDLVNKKYVFDFIPNPVDSEFDICEIFNYL